MSLSDRSPLTPELCISEILDRWPSTLSVFLKYRMACVGCGMSSFESLSSAAEIYDLPLPELISELEAAIQAPPAR